MNGLGRYLKYSPQREFGEENDLKKGEISVSFKTSIESNGMIGIYIYDIDVFTLSHSGSAMKMSLSRIWINPP